MSQLRVTPDSIAAAKAAAASERAAVQQATGLVIREDGQIVPSVVKVACGLCAFVASARDEGRALRGWAYHRVHMHGRTS